MKNENEYYKTIVSIANAFGVHRNSVRDWMEKEWWPEKHPHGWDKAEVQDAVDQYEASRDGVGEESNYTPGTREEKTALECARLKIVIEKEKELLEQAKEETRRMVEEAKRVTRKLIPKSEVEEGLTEFMGQLRSVIQSWCKSAQADDPENHEAYDRAVKLYLDKIQEIGTELKP